MLIIIVKTNTVVDNAHLSASLPACLPVMVVNEEYEEKHKDDDMSKESALLLVENKAHLNLAKVAVKEKRLRRLQKQMKNSRT